MKRKLQGSVTVEAAFLVPMILLLISVTINLLFYYHDKVVLKGAVHETVMVMSNQEEISEEEMEQYF